MGGGSCSKLSPVRTGLSPLSLASGWHGDLVEAHPGGLLHVDPMALRSSVDIVSKNARSCVCISSSEFGDVLFVAIGATGVATIRFVSCAHLNSIAQG